MIKEIKRKIRIKITKLKCKYGFHAWSYDHWLHRDFCPYCGKEKN